MHAPKALTLLDFGTRWGWVVSVTPQPHFTPVERTPRYPLDKMLGGLGALFLRQGPKVSSRHLNFHSFRFLVSSILILFSSSIRGSPSLCDVHDGHLLWRDSDIQSLVQGTRFIPPVIIIRGATALTNLGRLSSRRWQSFPTASDDTGLTCGQHIESHTCIFSSPNWTVTSLFK
jgi:hypothetical protein